MRDKSHYECLVSLLGEMNIGKSPNHSMELIEQDYESMSDILPKDYVTFGDDR